MSDNNDEKIDRCPRCNSERQTRDCGGNTELFHCQGTERWQSSTCEFLVEIQELTAVNERLSQENERLAKRNVELTTRLAEELW